MLHKKIYIEKCLKGLNYTKKERYAFLMEKR